MNSFCSPVVIAACFRCSSETSACGRRFKPSLVQVATIAITATYFRFHWHMEADGVFPWDEMLATLTLVAGGVVSAERRDDGGDQFRRRRPADRGLANKQTRAHAAVARWAAPLQPC